jgi:2',3'-cyclic-nucleotide 2'-phosphodiesterase (5'-nucleotidase family)
VKRLTTAAALFTGLVLAVAGSAAARPDVDPPGQAKKETTTIQLLSVSDWHGQLTPLGSPPNLIGGAAALKAYFDGFRAANPNTLTFMAGDSWGASPPISSFFEDRPAVDAMNMMGISADTFGNHNFDRGVAHLASQVARAEFPFVAANLTNLNTLPGVAPRTMFTFGDVDVAVIGIVNEEAPTLVAPGSFGPIEITDSVNAANKTALEARKAGAEVVVVLTHKGIRGFNPDGSAFGELIDFANGVAAGQIDVILGDHTDFQYSAVHQDRILVVENRSKGATFAEVDLEVDGNGKVVSRSAAFHVPLVSGVTPDPAIQAFIDELNAELAPILGVVVGESTKEILRADQCGRGDGRLCESLVGNVVTDALRANYGTAFAITNSGGLRAALTCPAAGGVGSGFCPSGITPPPFPITVGAVFGVLPFGNFSVTVDISGAELKAMLERGVSAMPGADGRFPQVSGLCFTYNIAATAGSRVLSAVHWDDEAGECSSTPVDLTAATTYAIATNDFTASGGDGYPNFTGRFSSLGVLLATDVANYVEASSPINPFVRAFPNGRINCADSNGSAAPNCPTLTPSPPVEPAP